MQPKKPLAIAFGAATAVLDGYTEASMKKGDIARVLRLKPSSYQMVLDGVMILNPFRAGAFAEFFGVNFTRLSELLIAVHTIDGWGYDEGADKRQIQQQIVELSPHLAPVISLPDSIWELCDEGASDDDIREAVRTEGIVGRFVDFLMQPHLSMIAPREEKVPLNDGVSYLEQLSPWEVDDILELLEARYRSVCLVDRASSEHRFARGQRIGLLDMLYQGTSALSSLLDEMSYKFTWDFLLRDTCQGIRIIITGVEEDEYERFEAHVRDRLHRVFSRHTAQNIDRVLSKIQIEWVPADHPVTQALVHRIPDDPRDTEERFRNVWVYYLRERKNTLACVDNAESYSQRSYQAFGLSPGQTEQVVRLLADFWQ